MLVLLLFLPLLLPLLCYNRCCCAACFVPGGIVIVSIVIVVMLTDICRRHTCMGRQSIALCSDNNLFVRFCAYCVQAHGQLDGWYHKKEGGDGVVLYKRGCLTHAVHVHARVRAHTHSLTRARVLSCCIVVVYYAVSVCGCNNV